MEEGEFKRNLLDGRGRRVWQNGYRQEGRFEQGRYLGE
jgi:hypothetical protein